MTMPGQALLFDHCEPGLGEVARLVSQPCGMGEQFEEWLASELVLASTTEGWERCSEPRRSYIARACRPRGS